MNSSMRLTRCRFPARRVRCSCPCDHARGQLVWVVADQTPQRPAIAPASRPDRPSSWQGSMPRRPARERRPYLDEASTAVFRWAAFRRCAFGVEAFASAPLHECLGCGSSHSPEMSVCCGRPRRRHRPRRPRRRPRRPRRRPVPHVPPRSLRALPFERSAVCFCQSAATMPCRCPTLAPARRRARDASGMQDLFWRVWVFRSAGVVT